jgi:hypothetical protein
MRVHLHLSSFGQYSEEACCEFGHGNGSCKCHKLDVYCISLIEDLCDHHQAQVWLSEDIKSLFLCLHCNHALAIRAASGPDSPSSNVRPTFAQFLHKSAPVLIHVSEVDTVSAKRAILHVLRATVIVWEAP